MPSTKNNRLDGRWWLKWWTRETLYGSFMTSPLDELGFFLKLTCLAKQMDSEDNGMIKADVGIGLPHSSIAGMLQMEVTEFDRLLKVQKDKGRIVEDNSGVITIVNYKFYQHDKGAIQRSNASSKPVSGITREARKVATVNEVADYDPQILIDALKRRNIDVGNLDICPDEG